MNLPAKQIPIIPIIVTLAIFILDLLTPRGVDLWVFYLIPFLLINQSHRSRLLVIMAWITSFLAIVGLVLSPEGLDFLSAAVNRTMGVGVLWMSVLLLKRLDQRETERHLLQEQAVAAGRRVENILETIADAFVALDRNWCYTFMNKKAGEIFGRDPKQMIGKHIWTEFPERVGQPFHRACEQAMVEQQFRSVEEYNQPVDRWYENRIHPSKDGLIIFFTDMTERRRMTEALRRGEEKFSKIFQKVPFAAALSSTPDFVLLEVNEKFESLWGYSSFEAVGRTSEELGLVPNVSERERLITVFHEQGFLRNVETKFQAKSGALIDVVINSDLVMIGNERYILTTAQDITERKGVEEALLESERRYRALFEKMSAGSVVFEVIQTEKGTPSDLLIIAANKGFEATTGLRNREAIGKRLTHILPGIEKDPADWIGTYGRIALTGEPRQFEARSPLLGRYYSVTAYQSAPKQCAVTFVDITERKQAEEALRESEARFQRAVEDAPLPMLIHAEDGEIVMVNHAWTEITGYNHKEIPTIADWTERAYGVRKKMVREDIDRLYGASEPTREGEYVIKTKSGDERTWDFSSSPVGRMPDGRRLVLSLAADVTERKRAEVAVEAHRKLLETVVNHIPASVSLLRGSDLRVQLINPAYQAIAPGKQMIGKTWDELWPETGQDFAAICRRVLEAGEPYHVVDELNMIRRTPEGEAEPAYFSWSLYRIALPDNEGWGLLGTAWETTLRKQAEEEIRHSREQLRALTGHLQTVIEEERARIAREIHDDIGQIFTAVKMDLSLLDRTIKGVREEQIRTALSGEIRALIGMLDGGVQSIRKIVRDLRPEALETMGLLAGIEWQAKEFEKRTKVRVSLALPKREPTLDKQKTVTLFRIVQEALANIARHADATTVTIELQSGSEETQVTISDNGKGITEENLKKPHSFGLLAMRERVSALGGELSISGKPGEGTRVEVKLGRSEEHG